MSSTDSQKISQREVAFPRSVSEAARRTLVFWSGLPPRARLALDDVEGWRELARCGDAGAAMILSERIAADRSKVSSTLEIVDGVGCYLIGRLGQAINERIILDIHGGGFTSGGGEVCEMSSVPTAAGYDALIYAVDYRTPPDYPGCPR